ncbi:hypothetical protein X471_00836 [Bartonella bacilliformis str. Heidi Mejia]|nr:hypothetical protein X471_00836 [Bartonella bacilliformis str. Heidi Mejia]
MNNLSNAGYRNNKNYNDTDGSLGRDMVRSAMQAPSSRAQKRV